VEVKLHAFFNLSLNGGEWSFTFLPLPQSPLVSCLGGHQGWSGHGCKEKSPCSFQESNPSCPSIPSHFTDWVFQNL